MDDWTVPPIPPGYHRVFDYVKPDDQLWSYKQRQWTSVSNCTDMWGLEISKEDYYIFIRRDLSSISSGIPMYDTYILKARHSSGRYLEINFTSYDTDDVKFAKDTAIALNTSDEFDDVTLHINSKIPIEF